jgi:hypothetical protein
LVALTSDTVAPGMTEPLASVTPPETEPLVICADADLTKNRSTKPTVAMIGLRGIHLIVTPFAAHKRNGTFATENLFEIRMNKPDREVVEGNCYETDAAGNIRDAEQVEASW